MSNEGDKEWSNQFWRALRRRTGGGRRGYFGFFLPFLRALKSAITYKATYAYEPNNKKIVNQGGADGVRPTRLFEQVGSGTHFQMG